MKIGVILEDATKDGRCLSAEEVAGTKSPGFLFQVMGVLGRLVANGIAGEAEGSDGQKRYFLKKGEEGLVNKGVLSKEVHVYLSVPVRDGTVLVGRVNEGDVDEREWGGILAGDSKVIVDVARKRGIVGENDRPL